MRSLEEGGGVGQLGMAHPSDGPASSLRMFGHVHRAMCSDGRQFEVLEEHVGAAMRGGGVGGLGFRDDGAARPLYCKACGWYSAATSEAMAISKARVFCNDTISA